MWQRKLQESSYLLHKLSLCQRRDPDTTVKLPQDDGISTHSLSNTRLNFTHNSYKWFHEKHFILPAHFTQRVSKHKLHWRHGTPIFKRNSLCKTFQISSIFKTKHKTHLVKSFSCSVSGRLEHIPACMSKRQGNINTYLI